MARPILYGPDNEPIDLEALKKPLVEANVASVRRVEPEHPSWGLSPEGLGTILRDSETHDPSRLYALLDDVFEKEWHYRGVLGTRRMALAMLPITVDPASDAASDVDLADECRAMLTQPAMVPSLFDLSDALNKGISFGDIDWDTSEAQWMPRKIAWTDQRWFRFNRVDLATPELLDDTGMPQPLKPYKTVIHRPRLFSGLPIRDGLGRSACWAWMFKNFDIKGWLAFMDKFGLPLRLGKFPASATPAEKRFFLNSLRNMGRDAAAIVGDGYTVEFPSGGGAGEGDGFKAMADYFDEQMSKLVLGQTGTTDASKGGYAVGRVHEGVKDAICLYDGMMLAMTLGEQLVKPYIDLNHGPQKQYPRVKIGLGDEKNIDLVLKYLGEMADRGLPIEASQVYPLLGLTEPAKGKDVVLLQPRSTTTPGTEPGGPPPAGDTSRAGSPRRGGPRDPSTLSAAADAPPAHDRPPHDTPPHDTIDQATEEILKDLGWAPDITALQAALAKCRTIEEARQVLRDHLDTLGTDKLAETLARARFSSYLAADTED